MLLYLSSYMLGNKTMVLKEWIYKNNDNKILLIMNARDHKTDSKEQKMKINEHIKMLEDIGFKVKILDLKNYFNNYSKLIEDISSYKAFCITGGNVFVLRKAMKLSGFDKYLKTICHNDNYLYIGYSAGCCVLADSLIGYDLVDEVINPYDDSKTIWKGIGLIDYAIAPHYKSNHVETILVDKMIKFFNQENIHYKKIKDGEVIIDNVK